MPRPNSAHVLSSQLGQAIAFYASKGVPVPAVSPASSTAFDRDPFDMLATSSISHSSTSPLYPSTPSGVEPLANWIVVGEGAQLPTLAIPTPTKSTARLASRPVDQLADEEATDDELEAELNDCGYGARPRKQKEKKESLLDILNSEPPPWLTRQPVPLEPIDFEPTPSIESKRSLTAKLRRRLRASTTSAKAPAVAVADPTEGLSTLRPSRSSGNLLSGFSLRSRGKTSNAPAPYATNARGPPPQMLPYDLPPLAMPSPPAPYPPLSRPVKRLAAKSAATSKESSTRDLVDFLNAAGPAPGRGLGASRDRPSLPPPNRARSTQQQQQQQLASKQSAPVFARSATYQGLSRSAGPAYRDFQPLSALRKHSAEERATFATSEQGHAPASDPPPPAPTYRRRSIAAETAFLRADSGDSVISFASIQRTPPRAPPARRISRKPVPSVIIDQLDDLRRTISYSASTDALNASACVVKQDHAADDYTVEYVESPQQEQRRESYPNFRDSFCTAASTPLSSAESHGSQRIGESMQADKEGTTDDEDAEVVEQLRALQRVLGEFLTSGIDVRTSQGAAFESSLAILSGSLRSASQAIDKRLSTGVP